MESKGTLVDKFSNIEWIKDFVWFDGPFVSRIRENTQDYLFHWSDCDVTKNRWLVVEFSDEQLPLLHSSYKEFMRTRPNYWIVDIADDTTEAYSVVLEEISEYLPNGNLFE